jgi:nicotinamidase/pyrazinamidase
VKNIFFLDVDTQHDFMMPSGALYVPGAERLRPKLRRIFEFARANNVTILSSADAHSENDPEFELDETLLARPAILENKPIDRNLIELVKKYQQIIVEKQSLDMFDNPVSERLIRALPQRAVVFGVTTEYCVKYAALGLRKLGVKAALVSDVISALKPSSGKDALEEMRKAGVELISSETLMGIS